MSQPETTTATWLREQLAAARDEGAIRAFSEEMMRKMARGRALGRGGWQTCPVSDLWQMLREHVEKGDPVDVANLAMMIHQNAARANARKEWRDTNRD